MVWEEELGRFTFARPEHCFGFSGTRLDIPDKDGRSSLRESSAITTRTIPTEGSVLYFINYIRRNYPNVTEFPNFSINLKCFHTSKKSIMKLSCKPSIVIIFFRNHCQSVVFSPSSRTTNSGLPLHIIYNRYDNHSVPKFVQHNRLWRFITISQNYWFIILGHFYCFSSCGWRLGILHCFSYSLFKRTSDKETNCLCILYCPYFCSSYLFYKRWKSSNMAFLVCFHLGLPRNTCPIYNSKKHWIIFVEFIQSSKMVVSYVWLDRTFCLPLEKVIYRRHTNRVLDNDFWY